MRDALVHRVVPPAVGLGLPIREAWFTPGQVCHHVVAAATVDYDVLDASPVALRPHTFTVRCNPSRSLNEIVITETVGADVTEFP